MEVLWYSLPQFVLARFPGIRRGVYLMLQQHFAEVTRVYALEMMALSGRKCCGFVVVIKLI